MSTAGTPFEGRDNVLGPAIYVSGNLQLEVYTNTANSLTDATVYADLTYPTGTGVDPIVLNGTYSFTNGQITYDDGTPDDPRWVAGDNWGGGNVVGIALTDGSYILHYKDLSAGPVTMENTDVLVCDLSTFLS